MTNSCFVCLAISSKHLSLSYDTQEALLIKLQSTEKKLLSTRKRNCTQKENLNWKMSFWFEPKKLSLMTKIHRNICLDYFKPLKRVLGEIAAAVLETLDYFLDWLIDWLIKTKWVLIFKCFKKVFHWRF